VRGPPRSHLFVKPWRSRGVDALGPHWLLHQVMAAIAAARLFLGVECWDGDGQEPLPEHVVLSAYRRRALLLHPDKNPGNPRAAEVFQALQDARDLLLGKGTAGESSSTREPTTTTPSKGASARGPPRRRPPSPLRTMPWTQRIRSSRSSKAGRRMPGVRALGGTESTAADVRHSAREQMTPPPRLARTDTSRRLRRRRTHDAGRRPNDTEES